MMNKKKMTLIIVGTLLAMALVAAILVLWLVPGNNTDAPAQTNSGAVTDDQTGDVTPDTTAGNSDEPTVGAPSTWWWRPCTIPASTCPTCIARPPRGDLRSCTGTRRIEFFPGVTAK